MVKDLKIIYRNLWRHPQSMFNVSFGGTQRGSLGLDHRWLWSNQQISISYLLIFSSRNVSIFPSQEMISLSNDSLSKCRPRPLDISTETAHTWGSISASSVEKSEGRGPGGLQRKGGRWRRWYERIQQDQQESTDDGKHTVPILGLV